MMGGRFIMKIITMLIRALPAVGLTAAASGPLMASETVTYSYDAKGRLVIVERSGTVNNNVKTEYEHDDADNRKRVTTTGSN